MTKAFWKGSSCYLSKMNKSTRNYHIKVNKAIIIFRQDLQIFYTKERTTSWDLPIQDHSVKIVPKSIKLKESEMI